MCRVVVIQNPAPTYRWGHHHSPMAPRPCCQLEKRKCGLNYGLIFPISFVNIICISMPSYSLLHSNIDTQNGRCASLYISNMLNATPIVLCDEFCETVWVTMPLTGRDKLLIGCIYHSPTQHFDLNNTRLCNMLLKASNMKDFSHGLIRRNFNLPPINWSS